MGQVGQIQDGRQPLSRTSQSHISFFIIKNIYLKVHICLRFNNIHKTDKLFQHFDTNSRWRPTSILEFHNFFRKIQI